MNGPLEFGDGGYITSIDHRAMAPPIQHKAALNGNLVEGYAVKYNQVFWHDSTYKCVYPGAFDRSLDSDVPIEFWIQHQQALKLGDTTTNLEFHSDSYGLAFRLRLDHSEISAHARALVRTKSFTEMSIGYYDAKQVTRAVGDKSVLIILETTLQEVSLVQSGVCPTTHAMLNDSDDCGLLADDCKTMKFRCDNAYVELQRALQRAM